MVLHPYIRPTSRFITRPPGHFITDGGPSTCSSPVPGTCFLAGRQPPAA